MDHLRNNSMASAPSTGAAGTMFTVTDMTPETVISELNLFSKSNKHKYVILHITVWKVDATNSIMQVHWNT